MRLLEKLSKTPRSHSSGLLAATFLVSSILQLAPAAWASGTTAGTTISNTAQATYSDNAGVAQPPTTSNTVTVTVAEVAGMTLTSAGVTPAVAGASITPGSVLYYDYVITNTGNDATRFTIPNLATVTAGPGSINGSLSVDTGSGFVAISGGSFTTADIPVGGTIKVRVPIQVSPGATTGQAISIQLGNTPGDAQNQERTAATSQAGDVFTVDGTVPADAAFAPINGTREASATQTATVGSNPQAFAAILKGSAYTDNGTPSTLTDDKVTYSLSLRVDSAAPLGSTGFSAAPLAGTPITVDGATVTRILVSDAVPVSTVLIAGTPVAPSGWTTVYTSDLTATKPNSTLAAWTTVPGTTVARVGFINNGPVSAGTTVTGFSFQVVTSGVTSAGTSVRNLAQIFGTTPGGTILVYDESGDQNPSNFTDGPSPIADPFDPATNTGVPGATDGNDPGNNSGTGPDGEANLVSIAPPSTVLNGPSGAPTAIGPTSNNDDFTNKAALLVGTDPSPAAFTGTVQNSGTSTTPISLAPATVAAGTIPNGTKVTISYGSQSATYTYTGGVPATTGTPVVIPAADIPVGGIANYGVSVDLPAGAPTFTGIPVPVAAFIDLGPAGLDAADAQNTSIDRVYVGFMTLAKTARVLAADGATELVPAGTAITGNVPPGSIIEYNITYKNITEAQAGSGSNAVLDAKDIVVTENGTIGGLTGNNWALDNDSNGSFDTSNVLGSARDSGTGTVITFFSGATGATAAVDQAGTTATTDVTKYVDTITGPIGPGVSKTFTFRRKIN